MLYVETFINKGQATWATIALTLAGIWAATAINLRGVRSMGTIQLWTSILKFIPLLFIATVGLFFIDTDNFAVWNLSGQGVWQAIGGAMALCLFSYIGVESASVAAARSATRSATCRGPRSWARCCRPASTCCRWWRSSGSSPTRSCRQTTAPFATAAETMFGVAWAGSLMALVVVISGFGALNGWTMLAGEMPYAAAADGLFPEHFGRVSRRGVPAFGIVVSAILATAAVLLSHLGAAGITVFNTLVLMTGITGAIPYAFSAMAQIKWRIADGRAITRGRMVRDVGIAAVALVFSVLFIVYSTNGDAEGLARYEPFLFALGAYLIGLPVYWYNRGRMTAPGPVPPPVEARAS